MMGAIVFKPVKTRRIFEEAVAQIVEAISVGDLGVGGRLPSERTLAAQMEISRPTLREAIRVLSDAGIIEVKAGSGGGMFVRSDAIPSSLLERRSQLRVSEVSDVLEARRLLEPRVVQLAALYGTEEDFEVMRKTIEDQRQAARNRKRFLDLDIRFHLAIARATRNATVVSLMRLLLRQLEIARDMAIRAPHDSEWAIGIHERTLAAIMSGDHDAIEAAMDEHMSYLERIWEEESGRARLRKIPDFLLGRFHEASRI
jgi:GntR family transcriptional repressor for pyruvate dehydrogenase complex